MLEESFRLFRRAHAVRVGRMDGARLEGFYRVPVHHFFQFIVIPYFYLLIFVGGSETVEEMHHRQLACDGGKVGYCGQIHGLLDAVTRQHGKSGLTAAHDVGVVAEYGKGVGRQRSGCYVKYRRCLFTGQLIHVWNHQEKSLGSGKGGGIGTCRNSAVYCACRTAF